MLHYECSSDREAEDTDEEDGVQYCVGREGGGQCGRRLGIRGDD